MSRPADTLPRLLLPLVEAAWRRSLSRFTLSGAADERTTRAASVIAKRAAVLFISAIVIIIRVLTKRLEGRSDLRIS